MREANKRRTANADVSSLTMRTNVTSRGALSVMIAKIALLILCRCLQLRIFHSLHLIRHCSPVVSAVVVQISLKHKGGICI